MDPKPDNIYLLVDGLPSLSSDFSFRGNKEYVTEEDRLMHFGRAKNVRPKGIPIHVLFYTMEGDPTAPYQFFKLAQSTNGSFTVVSRDWPL